ncbi:MAG: hypothetical protein KA427_05215, partial [Trichococcus sp.]|nr:hypothetical protein [Trichococcus sp.]
KPLQIRISQRRMADDDQCLHPFTSFSIILLPHHNKLSAIVQVACSSNPKPTKTLPSPSGSPSSKERENFFIDLQQ